MGQAALVVCGLLLPSCSAAAPGADNASKVFPALEPLVARLSPLGLWCRDDARTSVAVALTLTNVSSKPVRFKTSWLKPKSAEWSNPYSHDFFSTHGNHIPTAQFMGTADCVRTDTNPCDDPPQFTLEPGQSKSWSVQLPTFPAGQDRLQLRLGSSVTPLNGSGQLAQREIAFGTKANLRLRKSTRSCWQVDVVK